MYRLQARKAEKDLVRTGGIRELRASGQVDRMTAEYLFVVQWVRGRPGQDIQKGVSLRRHAGPWVAVKEFKSTGPSAPIYNLWGSEFPPDFAGNEEFNFLVRGHTSDRCVHRVGGGDAKNLGLKPPEAKLDPPGISVLMGGTPAETVAAFRRVFGPKSSLGKAASTVGTAAIEQIRAVGFDVVPVPTNNFPNHGRIIHPTEGAAGFTPENLQRLSQVFTNTTGL